MRNRAACGLRPRSAPRNGPVGATPGASGPIMKLSLQSPIRAIPILGYMRYSVRAPARAVKPRIDAAPRRVADRGLSRLGDAVWRFLAVGIVEPSFEGSAHQHGPAG